MSPNKPNSTLATPLRKSARVGAAEFQTGPVGTTRYGRTKAGQSTPVRRSTRGHNVEVDPTLHGVSNDTLAPTSGMSKPGRTKDGQQKGKGGKEQYKVSLSYLFYSSRSEAAPLSD